MKQKPCRSQRILRQYRKIKLVDRYLIIVMIILMTQSLIGLFTPFGDESITDRIDVVMRTTMASIFGYFVSANFIHDDPEDDPPEIVVKIPADCIHSEPKQTQEALSEPVDSPPQPTKKNQLQLQVKVVGCVCIFSIFALVLIRYFAIDSTHSLAFIFLFRDFVCGCVGFLIGMPNEKPAD